MQSAKGPNLQAEEIPAQNNVYQSGIPYGGQQVVGQQVISQQYQQNYGYPQQQYYQSVNGYPPIGYQQVVYVGNQLPQQVIITQTQINPLLVAELELRHSIKYFYGCNCLCGVFVLIILILRCIILFEISDENSSNTASGIIFILGDFTWIISAIIGVYGISHYKERFLLHYQIGIIISFIFDLIASIIAFTRGNNIIGIFIFFILAMFVIYIMFIRSARNIRYKMQSIELLKQQQNLNVQQQVQYGYGNVRQNDGPILVQ